MKLGRPPVVQRVEELERRYEELAERMEKAEKRQSPPEPSTYQPLFQRWGPNNGSPGGA